MWLAEILTWGSWDSSLNQSQSQSHRSFDGVNRTGTIAQVFSNGQIPHDIDDKVDVQTPAAHAQCVKQESILHTSDQICLVEYHNPVNDPEHDV